jgi:hypothetical protein
MRYKLRTLLMLMVCAAIVAGALARPTHGWYGAIFLMALFAVLTSVLAIIYCVAERRAFAVGFLVFSTGYLLSCTLLTGSLNEALYAGWAPLQEVWDWLFDRVHSNAEGRTDFYAICNLALTCALGELGGAVSMILFENRRRVTNRSASSSTP